MHGKHKTPPDHAHIQEQLMGNKQEHAKGTKKQDKHQQLENATNKEKATTYKQDGNCEIYADDTNLLIPEEPIEETTHRLTRYSILAETLKLSIHREKELLLTKKQERR